MIIQIVINIPTPIERLLVLPVLLYRRICYGYAFRRIPLTRGMYAIVDPDDFWRLSRYKWLALKGQSTFYATRTVYPGKKRKPKVIWMHREIIKAGDNQVCDHINHYGSHHSDAIIAESEKAQKSFIKEVDSATVYVNASTRFTDGGEFGMGAEIGISTDKLHARGPMGLEELTTYKYVISGKGQIRE